VLAPEVAPRLCDLTEPEEIRRVIAAYSALNVRDPGRAVLGPLADQVLANMRRFSLEQLASIAESYANLGIAHMPLFSSIGAEIWSRFFVSDPYRATQALARWYSACALVLPKEAEKYAGAAVGYFLQYQQSCCQAGSGLAEMLYHGCWLANRMVLGMLQPFVAPAAERRSQRIPQPTPMESEVAACMRELGLRVEQKVFVPPSAFADIVTDAGRGKLAVVCEVVKRDRVGGDPDEALRREALVAEGLMRQAGFESVRGSDQEWGDLAPEERAAFIRRRLAGGA